MKTEIPTKSWKSYIPKSVSLYYVDYNENLNGQEALQEACIRQNSLIPLYEKVQEWYMEQETDNLDEILGHIKESMTKDRRLRTYRKHENEIRDMLYERNDTDPSDGLIRNSSITNMFYSLGVETDGCDTYGNTRTESETMTCHRIRRALRLKKGQYDDRILELTGNASYGGELRIYFNAMFNKLLTGDPGNDFKSIRFHGDVVVALADSRNGSGYDITLPIDVTLPFRRDNLFVDSQVHYSYADEVCGMCSDWCGSTKWETGMKPLKGSIRASRMAGHLQQEAGYEKTFREGKCTSGDMNYKRHRDTFYINSFPCGNRCPHCGTFWID
ncbi:hypothetical protein [Bacteroides reticulotermitis]|uniref:Uncharacterized protein n=2 Tax=Bacteroides reticulotermitis TaxID=1133319 RepID=W4UVA6_9BACE|nr:hypothetical protein [Bacteroides reticulotermitis]MBB4045742.1 hypothetical protein [Bacteroides reticulotermitis]GAE84881.1 hypothetical protein JCM10512_3257 [Bacteroides reticulotermitis JCM 10512]